MRELALFAGAGGGILGGHLLGWRTVCAVEIDNYNRRVLLARQRDGILPQFPIWDDVRTFDGKPWRGRVDVVSGGFPCQDISFAGKRKGIEGEKSGLWKEYARVIGEIEPRFVFAENSARLVGNGLSRVIEDLDSLGYDAEWGCISAADLGFAHKRDRCFVVAHSRKQGAEGYRGSCRSERWIGGIRKAGADGRTPRGVSYVMRDTEPGVERIVLDGVPFGVDRHYAIGNAQVPAVAATAFACLVDRLHPPAEL